MSPFPGEGEMAARMRGYDWQASALGPVAGWSPGLRTAVGICLSSKHPMVIWWGRELVLLYNDAWIPILGPSKHPALGRPGAVVWPEMWHIIGEQLHSVLATGEATWSDDQLLPADRFGYLEEAYFTYSYSAVRDEAERVAGVFTAVTETTRRVLGERRLRTLQDLGAQAGTARSVGEACELVVASLARAEADVPFAAVYLDLPGSDGMRLVAATPHEKTQALDRARWPVADALRSETPVVVHDVRERFGQLPRGGWSTSPREAMVLPLRGETRARAVGALVLAASGGRALDEDYRSFLGLVAEQTAALLNAALAYQAQRRRTEELTELDYTKTTFFSNVSHEFRTPLTLMMGPLEELRTAVGPAADDRLRAKLDVIHRNGLRLGKLVNTLLDFSRIQAGRMDASFEPVDLAAFTAELASVFRAAVENAGLEFRVDCPTLSEPVYVDREMWEKVVLNLLSNALKFTFTGSVTVSLRREAGCAVLRVADTGGGIPATEMPRLFERFHRVEPARARSTEGSGIGLALVAELVGLHGGSIDAESTLGVGTTFTLTVPLGSDHLPAGKVGSSAGGAGPSPTADPFLAEALRWLPDGTDTDNADKTDTDTGSDTAHRPRSGRVLVADDNADMREYLRRLLSARYDVQVAGDGLTALEVIRADPPDLVISDVMMPGLDGLELVATLRGDPGTARVPVLLLSARAGPDASVEGLVAGADDYLVKPFSAQELLARVGAHLALGRVRREAEDRFRAMADLAPALIWVSDPEGRRVFLNHGWQEFTGTTVQTCIGDGWRDTIHPADVTGYLSAAAAALAARRPVSQEYRLRRADGVYHWVLEHAVPVGTGESFVGYVGSCVDVNARYRETERQALLARVGAALDSETGVAPRMRRLARLMVETRLADQCTVRRVTGSGTLERVAEAALEPATEAVLMKLAPDTVFAGQVVRTGQPVLTHEVPGPDLAGPGPGSAEQAALRRQIGLRSSVLLPLTTRGVVLGVLGLGRCAHAPRYTEDDVPLLAEVTRRAALALDNALLLVAEQATAQRLELLQRATAELSAAATPVEVAQVAMTHLTELLGPGEVVVYELREQTLDALASLDWAPVGERDWASLPLGTPLPAADAARRGEPVWVEQPADWQREHPTIVAAVQTAGYCSGASLPLLVAGRCLGVIGLGFHTPQHFSPAERATAMSLADQCALALQRSRLLAAESEARKAAERFSAMVGALSGARTPHDVARVILDLATELGSEAVVVVVLRAADEALDVLDTRGYDHPAAESPPRRLPLGSARPLAYAVRTGQPVWLTSRSAAAWKHENFDLADLSYPVHVAVPFVLGTRCIGAVGMRFPERWPSFSPDERATILALAGQCAQALDRARLHQVEHEVAETLQRSLLPLRLPRLHRLAFGARYRAGAEGSRAGGDWYDVIPLDASTVAMAVGDVVGKGPGAAAVMGQLRSALAGYLLQGDGPAAALEHLDQFASRVRGALASTVACLVLDWDSGGLRWARAGHPPPLVVEPERSRYLDAHLGVPLGITGRRLYTEGHTVLAPGASVLLYTDGLIERREEDLRVGLERLVGAARGLHATAPPEFATDLLRRMLDDSAPRDDVALVVARLLPAPLHRRVPATASQLPALRRRVRSWSAAAALPEELSHDLALSLTEAAANAVEHAYRDREPGEFEYEVARTETGLIRVRVHDFGTWRPISEDNGYRGRGLAIIHRLGDRVVIETGAAGTDVRFDLPNPQSSPGSGTIRTDPERAAGPSPPLESVAEVAGGS